ncbi:hypothetical protein GCM10020218_013990 [Dactylosporangium vinaceum]
MRHPYGIEIQRTFTGTPHTSKLEHGVHVYKRKELSTLPLPTPLEGEDRCPCGAQLDRDNPTYCRKCRARTRYQRRHTGRQIHRRPGPNSSTPNN